MTAFTKSGEQYIKHVEAKVDPQDLEHMRKVVIAGMKVMFSKETHQYMVQMLEKKGDVGHKVGVGIVELMGLLLKQSKGNIKPQIIIPAGSILALRACEYLERTGEKMDMGIFGEAIKMMSVGIKRQVDLLAKESPQGQPQPQQPPQVGGMLQGA